VPPLVTPAAWDARLRGGAVLRPRVERFRSSDPSGSIWSCRRPVPRSPVLRSLHTKPLTHTVTASIACDCRRRCASGCSTREERRRRSTHASTGSRSSTSGAAAWPKWPPGGATACDPGRLGSQASTLSVLHALWRSAPDAQVPVAARGAAASLCQRRSFRCVDRPGAS